MHGHKKKKSEWDKKKKFGDRNRRCDWGFAEECIEQKPKRKARYHIADDDDANEYDDNQAR